MSDSVKHAQRKLLHEEKIYWDLHREAYNCQNEPFTPEVLQGLDAVMTPLLNMVHSVLFTLRSSATALTITRTTMHDNMFHRLRPLMGALYRLECLEPAAPDVQLRMQAQATYAAVDAAALSLQRAEKLLDEAVKAFAEATDNLKNAVAARRHDVFAYTVVKSANHEPAVAAAAADEGECYYCCEPIPSDQAGWILSPHCQHPRQLTCRSCTINIAFSTAQNGTKPHGVCPLCRAHFSWSAVHLTGSHHDGTKP